VALRDDFAILPCLVDITVDRAVEQIVGKSRARRRQGGVPAGGEQTVAVAQRVSRLAAALDLATSVGDHAALGKQFEEGGARRGSPPVEAVMSGIGFERRAYRHIQVRSCD
jgi:hypothetical protein